MQQYTQRMVVMHWLTLVLLVVAWWMGDSLDAAREAGTATLAGYGWHLGVGITILLFTLLRGFFRKADGVPPAMGDSLMDKVATGLKHLFYTLLVLIPLSGILTVIGSSVSRALLAGDASLLPKKYLGLMHGMHGLLVNLLIAAVVLHILGALKHQFVLKDGLMQRMSLRRKN